MTGCVDSVPSLYTTDCPTRTGTVITIHGYSFTAPGFEPMSIKITVDNKTCTDVRIVNGWTMTCELPSGTGLNHVISATFVLASSQV